MAAKAEGVVALVSRRLAGDEGAPGEIREVFATAARAVVADQMMLQAECERVASVLHDAGSSALLLKGSALGRWLYPAAYLRECSDIDLLFSSRAHADQAAAALKSAGYELVFSPGDIAHEFLCRRKLPGRQIDLDMHWQLASMPMLRSLLSFDELLTSSISLAGIAGDVRGLGPVHALVHACIHRAENLCANLGDRLKWLYDLHLLAEALTEANWDELLKLCVDRGLCGICMEALEGTQALFGTPCPARALQALRSQRKLELLDASRLADWNYMQRRNLASLPSARARVSWLWQRAFPTADYLGELYGVGTGPLSLWKIRLKRAFKRMANLS